MSHEIIENVDQVLTTGERAWHRLDANFQKPSLEREDLKTLHFPIREGKMFVTVEGEEIPLPDYKSIIADTRENTSIEGDFHPLHVAASDYGILCNESTTEAFLKSLDGVPHNIVSAGTLGGLEYFFLSAELIGAEKISLPDGSECKAFLSLFSSHNGTSALKVYDTTHRTVCMNTVRSSLSAAGMAGFKVTHSSGAAVKMDGMAVVLNNILKSRAAFEETMRDLYSIDIDLEASLKIALGFMAAKTAWDGKGKLSTRSTNQAEEIVRLSHKGKGNKGGNLFYLAQGGTEFWTGGLGTGGDTKSMGKKAFSADYGVGMDQKVSFLSMLAAPEKRNKARDLGEKVLLLSK